MSNRSTGDRFERRLAELLGSAGFWVHLMQQNKAGQPADLIAVKGDYHTLIDCKAVANNKTGFRLNRIEENQWYAMHRFEARGGHQGWFALQLEHGSIWFVPMHEMERMRKDDEKSIRIGWGGTVNEIPLCQCIGLTAWLEAEPDKLVYDLPEK